MTLRCFTFAAIALTTLTSASAVHGQTGGPQSAFEAFEVATIKPSAFEGPNAGRYMRMQSAHRFQVKNYTVNGLIAAAWDLNPKLISGGPAWVEQDRYDVIAATPGDLRPTYDDQMRMLRKLLNDRFELKFHREKKEFAIDELTVAKSGAKLKPSSAPPDEPYNVTTTLYPAASGGIDHAVLPAHNITIQQFASVLQRAILDRPVVDNTHLTGRFDFDLEWTPDSSNFGGTLPPGPPDSSKPSLFTAIQQQLGLRLEATRGLIDILVIDRLARPSDN
ncbi:MAG TPA: TIGR03435 family protein [Bryobacteraceae bacterium]|nr:TIGR03435 family protein [Bryobacteraceae bacterium]